MGRGEERKGTLLERKGWVGLACERRGEERRGEESLCVVEYLCIRSSERCFKSVVERKSNYAEMQIEKMVIVMTNSHNRFRNILTDQMLQIY